MSVVTDKPNNRKRALDDANESVSKMSNSMDARTGSSVKIPTRIPTKNPSSQLDQSNKSSTQGLIAEPIVKKDTESMTDGPTEPSTVSPTSLPIQTKGKKIIPCVRCINSLRTKLFKLKTHNGMIAYRDVVSLAKSYMYDMYTGATSDTVKSHGSAYNIEHAVIAKIVGPRPTDETFPFINKESYHDPHILFPTSKDVNTLRGNYVYGHVADSREKAIKLSVETGANISIVNKQDVLLNTKNTNPELGKLTTLTARSRIDPKVPEEDDIYIDDTRARMIRGDRNDFAFCNIGECIFQPSKKFSGDISRTVFYYFLMYAFDTTKRPYTGEQPWIGNVETHRIINCQGFNFDAWRKFFFDHVDDYYNWAKNDPITAIETERNKYIIKTTSVPNIFVGFKTGDGRYQSSTFDVVEDLLFGREHNHKQYEDLVFHQGTKHPYSIDYFQTRRDGYLYEDPMYNHLYRQVSRDMLCGDVINEENRLAHTNQQRLYGKVDSTTVHKPESLTVHKGGDTPRRLYIKTNMLTSRSHKVIC
ncbi:hypothetical protein YASMINEVIRUS_1485 [Yasminevirus sp. GU-2018]|uniref:Uncharacterized protein n=1 Tax=Yasminevirus sp. GU-2018 TaxID=2420051 RepID=A0A5K0UBG4_9VIRU|nr:hypothetical protein YASMINEVIRUS_1485 [Yasminevirus sp. GU-2018]